jgi:hypothetical protein
MQGVSLSSVSKANMQGVSLSNASNVLCTSAVCIAPTLYNFYNRWDAGRTASGQTSIRMPMPGPVWYPVRMSQFRTEMPDARMIMIKTCSDKIKTVKIMIKNNLEY